MRANKATSELTPDQKQQILDELIRIELAAQQATKDGLDKQPEVANRLDLTRQNVLAETVFQNFLKGKTPTEQELRAEYESQVAAMPKTEYRARHILVATETLRADDHREAAKGWRLCRHRTQGVDGQFQGPGR